MKIPPFKLEEFWKKFEFTSPYLLCASDAEAWSVSELLELSDPESRKLWDNLILGYTEVEGHPKLREEISKLYSSLNKDQIITMAGGEEGIYCTLQTMLSKEDHVIVIEPCYQSLKTLCEVKANLTSIFLDEKKEWKLSLKELEKAFQPNTKLIVINYPHNPTGSLLDKDTFEGMIDLARKNGAYIFSDEMYRYMEINQNDRLPSIADAYEKGITLFGMTKPFGLAGLRIGWLASKDENFLKEISRFKVYTSICNSAPSEVLALIALRSKEKILKRNRNIMKKNLTLLDQFFERNKSIIQWIRPQSGTVGVVKLLFDTDIELFCEKLLKEAGVLIMPGSVVDLPGNFFRIGFGRKNMPEVLGKFENFLRSYAGI